MVIGDVEYVEELARDSNAAILDCKDAEGMGGFEGCPFPHVSAYGHWW